MEKMWYAVCMKRRGKKQGLQLKEGKRKRGGKRGFGVAGTFFVTLFIMLSLGIAGILLLKLIGQEGEENKAFAEGLYAQETIHFIPESISERL